MWLDWHMDGHWQLHDDVIELSQLYDLLLYYLDGGGSAVLLQIVNDVPTCRRISTLYATC